MMKESDHDYYNFCIVDVDVSPTLKLHYYRALLELLLKQKVPNGCWARLVVCLSL